MASPAPPFGPPPDDLVELGRIAAAHGVRGWLKVQAYSADGLVLAGARVWWLRRPPSALAGQPAHSPAQPYRVLSCQPSTPGRLLAQLDGVTDRDAAAALRGFVLSVPRAEFPPPAPGETYWVDLIGCDFYGLDGTRRVLLGRVGQVLDNGAHAILQVDRGSYDDAGAWRPQSDVRGRPVQVLVPYVAAHVLQVDVPARQIISNWPAVS